MSWDIYTAATGQAMGREDPVTGKRINGQMTISSTWHEPDGTMTELLKQARKKRWPVFQWCYKENLRGWLTEETVAEKRAQVTRAVFQVEYDLQEPSPERRVMLPESDDYIEAAIFEREALMVGDEIEGPAIVEQLDTTTLIEPGWRASVEVSGNLLLTRI